MSGGNADRMDAAYRGFTGIEASCGAIANEKKRLLIEKDLYGGLENLVYQLKAIASRFPHASDFTLSGFRRPWRRSSSTSPSTAPTSTRTGPTSATAR